MEMFAESHRFRLESDLRVTSDLFPSDLWVTKYVNNPLHNMKMGLCLLLMQQCLGLMGVSKVQLNRPQASAWWLGTTPAHIHMVERPSVCQIMKIRYVVANDLPVDI